MNLILKKSSARTYVHPIMVADVETYIIARSPRHILTVFTELVLYIHVMVNLQLSKRVSADQCHMTLSRAQVYNSLSTCLI